MRTAAAGTAAVAAGGPGGAAAGAADDGATTSGQGRERAAAWEDGSGTLALFQASEASSDKSSDESSSEEEEGEDEAGRQHAGTEALSPADIDMAGWVMFLGGMQSHWQGLGDEAAAMQTPAGHSGYACCKPLPRNLRSMQGVEVEGQEVAVVDYLAAGLHSHVGELEDLAELLGGLGRQVFLNKAGKPRLRLYYDPSDAAWGFVDEGVPWFNAARDPRLPGSPPGDPTGGLQACKGLEAFHRRRAQAWYLAICHLMAHFWGPAHDPAFHQRYGLVALRYRRRLRRFAGEAASGEEAEAGAEVEADVAPVQEDVRSETAEAMGPPPAAAAQLSSRAVPPPPSADPDQEAAAARLLAPAAAGAPQLEAPRAPVRAPQAPMAPREPRAPKDLPEPKEPRAPRAPQAPRAPSSTPSGSAPSTSGAQHAVHAQHTAHALHVAHAVPAVVRQAASPAAAAAVGQWVDAVQCPICSRQWLDGELSNDQLNDHIDGCLAGMH